jgi:hypothetical protein
MIDLVDNVGNRIGAENITQARSSWREYTVILAAPLTRSEVASCFEPPEALLRPAHFMAWVADLGLTHAPSLVSLLLYDVRA